MREVKIVVVCGSGVAMAMHAAYKLRGYLEKENLHAHIDGLGDDELPSRINDYDIVISNIPMIIETDKPVFNAIPLITGVGEKELVKKVIQKVKEIQEAKGNG